MKPRLRLLTIVALLLASGFASAQDLTWGRTDTQKEIEFGRQEYELVVQGQRLSRNEAYCKRVERLFSQLTRALESKPYPFQAVVVADNEVNAYCLPGGYIVVYEGLIASMPDDNQLASVLGHEIGHGYRRHWARRTRKSQSDRALAALVSVLTRSEINEYNLALKYLAHTRDHEREADAFGTELYLRAGFDPTKVADGMKVFAAEEKESGHRRPEYLLSHPYAANRVVDIEATAARLIQAGLKPKMVEAPEVSIESVFGVIPTLASEPSQWQPTAPGTQWRYEVRTASASSSYRTEAVGAAQVNGTTVCRMKTSVGGREIFYQTIVDEDRVWRRNRPEDAKSVWSVETVFPLEEGVETAGKWTFKNAGLERVETPAGTFESCLKLLAQEEGGRTLTLWYASGVGLVRRLNEKSGIDEILVEFKKP